LEHPLVSAHAQAMSAEEAGGAMAMVVRRR
jgi:hypothetical protein